MNKKQAILAAALKRAYLQHIATKRDAELAALREAAALIARAKGGAQ